MRPVRFWRALKGRELVLEEAVREGLEGNTQPAMPVTAPTPQVSVIIPVYNGGDDFVRCLEALASSPPTPTWELLVVDDGSTDASAERARAFGARVLTSPRPQSGPAVARNAGAAVARGEILFFVDADVVVTPRTIGEVVAVFEEEPALAALLGSYDCRPGAPNFVSQYKNLFHHYVHQTSHPNATSFWTGCGAIRRTVFHELGGFSTDYERPSIEDIELGYRLTRAGYSVRLCHHIQVTHLKRWTPASLLRTDIVDRGIPWVQLLLRERVFTADLNLQTSNRISVICIYLLWASLLGVMIGPILVGASVALMIALLALNAPLYGFFLRQRGFRFLLAAIPWHWLYYTYNGLCFVAGLLLFALRSRSARPAPREQGGNPPTAPVFKPHLNQDAAILDVTEGLRLPIPPRSRQ